VKPELFPAEPVFSYSSKMTERSSRRGPASENATPATPPMQSRRLIIRHILLSVGFVVLYLLLNRPEVIFFARAGVVAWYPAMGLVVALLLGVSPWYAVLACLSDFLASSVIYSQSPRTFSYSVAAIGISVCYGMAAYLLRGPLRIDLGLRRRRDVVRYVVVTAAAAVGASIIGVGCLLADRSIAWSDVQSSAFGWFLGDAVSLAGIAPFLLVHVMPRIRNWLAPAASDADPGKVSPPRAIRFSLLAEGCGQMLAITVALWAIFGSSSERYHNFYMCFIPIIWIAMRQGIRRVVTGMLVVNVGISLAMHIFPPTPVLFAKIAMVMWVLSAVGLIVGSEVSERHRLAIDLQGETAYLDSLIQNSPLGIVVLGRQGRVELANSAFEKLFQYNRADLSAIDIERIGVIDVADSEHVIPLIFAGNKLHRTVRHRRKDGCVLDLALHGVPLLLNGEVRGAYLIYEDISEQIRAQEAQRQHAESLDQLVKELDLRTKQMSLLNEMGSLLECSGTVKEAAAVVAASVQRLFPEALAGGLFVFKSSRNLIEEVIRWGEAGISEAAFRPDACWSLRRGQPHWSKHPGSGVTCQHLARSENAECLCLPMVAQGNTIGVLYLEFESPAQPGCGSGIENQRDSYQRLAVSAGSQIAMSLASQQLREGLREQSIRDPLTRLFNRRFMEESLERELQLAGRKKETLAILFLDLDHFKRFNDNFGHDAGDMVLQALADLLRNYFRATDICCRYGGEEFVIILPASSSKDAGTRAEELRLQVKNLQLHYKNQAVGQLTISAGVAAYPDHAKTADELLSIADRCLYASKSRGRDIVTVGLLKAGAAVPEPAPLHS
jgi:diguanylate cyclase (GGDEF)-like protein/PAS domain S-box-containing protein